LQIAEPGQAPAPHAHRLAIGIDLGTTNSLVATVRSGMPVVVPDAEGRALLPSIVRYAPQIGFGGLILTIALAFLIPMWQEARQKQRAPNS